MGCPASLGPLIQQAFDTTSHAVHYLKRSRKEIHKQTRKKKKKKKGDTQINRKGIAVAVCRTRQARKSKHAHAQVEKNSA
jgi:hypothetical protein